jgi:hypothetical protein
MTVAAGRLVAFAALLLASRLTQPYSVLPARSTLYVSTHLPSPPRTALSKFCAEQSQEEASASQHPR